MKFEELRVKPPILRNAKRMGFEKLTEIQERTISKILNGKDIVGQAETGSGKTVAFSLPVLDKMEAGKGVQTLVLTPTRELCLQVAEVFADLGRDLNLAVTSVYGGVSIEDQIKRLRSTDVVIGTPGRVLDHINRKTIDLSRVRFLILDETDRMFDMGFIEDVEKIIRHVPNRRQTLMFSATISGFLDHIINKHLIEPIFVYTKTQVDKRKLKQVYYEIVNHNLKFSLLTHLLKHETSGLALVFCATRRESDIVAQNLKKQGLNASAIHGGMSQHSREKSMDAMKSQKLDILVATDVAARGIDIRNVTHVYNYDVPKNAKDYIHRIGRTARAGEKGETVTLLTQRDHDIFRKIIIENDLDMERARMPRFKRVFFDRGLSNESHARRFPMKRTKRSVG